MGTSLNSLEVSEKQNRISIIKPRFEECLVNSTNVHIGTFYRPHISYSQLDTLQKTADSQFPSI